MSTVDVRCDHESASGVDLTPSGPDKIWRCDVCGWLHRVVHVDGQPDGTIILRGLNP